MRLKINLEKIKSVKVRIITIGDEILFGQIIDSNSAYIAKYLTKIGLEIEEILSIHDKHSSITNTLKRLFSETDIFIITGGLGPTKDDVSKLALSDFLDSELTINEEVLTDLKKRFAKINRPMNNLNHNQALIPKISIPLPNPLGTAPGIWTEFNGKILINLPGVPFEMKNLIKTEVLPRLQKKLNLPYVIHHFLSVSHFPESDLSLHINDWEDNLPENIHLAYLPEREKIKLRLTAIGKNKDELKSQIQSEVQKVIPLLKNHLDSSHQAATEKILGKRLKKSGLTLSTAESCTGGMIAHLLTSVSGSSAYYKGSIVSYATEIKEDLLNVPKEIIEKYTVVSKEVAIAMAKGACEKLNTDIAVSTTGVAGPNKGEDQKEVGWVWIAVSNGVETSTKSYFLPYLERDDFILHISKLALQFTLDFVHSRYS